MARPLDPVLDSATGWPGGTTEAIDLTTQNVVRAAALPTALGGVLGVAPGVPTGCRHASPKLQSTCNSPCSSNGSAATCPWSPVRSMAEHELE